MTAEDLSKNARELYNEINSVQIKKRSPPCIYRNGKPVIVRDWTFSIRDKSITLYYAQLTTPKDFVEEYLRVFNMLPPQISKNDWIKMLNLVSKTKQIHQEAQKEV